MLGLLIRCTESVAEVARRRADKGGLGRVARLSMDTRVARQAVAASSALGRGRGGGWLGPAVGYVTPQALRHSWWGRDRHEGPPMGANTRRRHRIARVTYVTTAVARVDRGVTMAARVGFAIGWWRPEHGCSMAVERAPSGGCRIEGGSGWHMGCMGECEWGCCSGRSHGGQCCGHVRSDRMRHRRGGAGNPS